MSVAVKFEGLKVNLSAYRTIKNSLEVGKACVAKAEKIERNVRAMCGPRASMSLLLVQPRGDLAGELTRNGELSGAHAMVSIPFEAMHLDRKHQRATENNMIRALHQERVHIKRI